MLKRKIVMTMIKLDRHWCEAGSRNRHRLDLSYKHYNADYHIIHSCLKTKSTLI